MDGYKYSRYRLFRTIKDSQKTPDGHYWVPFISDLLELKGNIKDTQYHYDREIFFKKMFFTELDLEYFMSQNALDDVNMSVYKDDTLRFYETNKDLGNLDVNMKLYKEDFTVGELIDCYVFKYQNK